MSRDLDRLKAAYAKWNESKGKSIPEWLELIADRCDIRSLANGAATLEFTKPRETREEFAGYLEALTGQMDMEHYTTRFFMEDGDRIAVFGTTAWTIKSTGKRVESLIATFWRFKDGKAVEFAEFYDTAAFINGSTIA